MATGLSARGFAPLFDIIFTMSRLAERPASLESFPRVARLTRAWPAAYESRVRSQFWEQKEKISLRMSSPSSRIIFQSGTKNPT
jgi:hypothetical protein